MPETNKKDMNQAMQFDAIQIGLASPEKIREWSHGLSLIHISEPTRH